MLREGGRKEGRKGQRRKGQGEKERERLVNDLKCANCHMLKQN